MPTINEIRDTIQEYQDYGYADISLEIAVTLLAEVDRLREALRPLAEYDIRETTTAATVWIWLDEISKQAKEALNND